MLVKVLGAMDLIAGAVLGLSVLAEIPIYVFAVVGVAILIKSFLGFPKDFAGWIDFLTGTILILTAFIAIPGVVKIIMAILIFQKGVSSFL